MRRMLATDRAGHPTDSPDAARDDLPYPRETSEPPGDGSSPDGRSAGLAW